MTLGEMILLVREELLSFSRDLQFRDGHSTDTRNAESPVVSASITKQLNKAKDVVARRTGYYVTSITPTMTNGSRVLTVPAGTIKLWQVDLTGTGSLLKTTIGEITRREPKWRASTTAGVPRRFIVSGSSRYELDLIPTAGIVSAGATGIASGNPPDLSLLADVPALLDAVYHGVLVDGAAMFCAAIDARNPAAKDRFNSYRELFEQGIAELSAQVNYHMGADLDAPYNTKLYPPPAGGAGTGG